MKQIAQLLNEMLSAGIIQNYALFGALAQMRYTEAVATMDADMLVAVPSEGKIDLLKGIYDFCAKKGYTSEGEAIRVGAWPVQFIPAFSPLTLEAMNAAETADFEGVPFRVVRADYLAAIALSVGRAKDFARILALLESGHAKKIDIERIADKFGLADAWGSFKKRFLDERD